MATTTTQLLAIIRAQDSASGVLKRVRGQFLGLGKDIDTAGSRARLASQQIGTGIKRAAYIAAGAVGFLATQIAFGARSLIELERINAQTNATLKSTGGIAGVTAGQVRSLAEEYEGLNATIDDKVIQSAENLLLTFTNIRGQAFEPTLKAILDMNTALGGGEEGLANVARQVGKALNDPARGLAALGRVGVRFTADQEKRIKALTKEGKLYEAQAIVLAELERRFGGSFAAAGRTTEGTFAKIGDAVEDLQKSLAEALLPTIRDVADRLAVFLARSDVQQSIRRLGQAIASLFTKDRLDAAASALTKLMDVANRIPWDAIADGFALAGSIVQTAVSAFMSLPPEIQALAVAGLAINKLTGGLVTNLAGGLISTILGRLSSAVVNVTAPVVNVNGGVGGLGGGKGGIPPVVAGGGAAAAGGLGIAGIVSAVVPAAIMAAMLAAPYIFRGKEGTGPRDIRVSNFGEIDWQLAGQAYGNSPGLYNALNRTNAPIVERTEAVAQATNDLALAEQRRGERSAGQTDALHRAVDTTNDRLERNRAAISTTNALARTLARVGEATKDKTADVYAAVERNRTALINKKLSTTVNVKTVSYTTAYMKMNGKLIPLATYGSTRTNVESNRIGGP